MFAALGRHFRQMFGLAGIDQMICGYFVHHGLYGSPVVATVSSGHT